MFENFTILLGAASLDIYKGTAVSYPVVAA